MSKRKTGLFYFAAFFLIMGAAGFIMPLIRGSEIGVFSIFGAYAVFAKIGCLAVGAVLAVIGLIRYLGSLKTSADEGEKKPE
jgi:hypothetical protein